MPPPKPRPLVTPLSATDPINPCPHQEILSEQFEEREHLVENSLGGEPDDGQMEAGKAEEDELGALDEPTMAEVSRITQQTILSYAL